ncbi:hypothetical protein [Terrihabitans sp. B22-R8]|uniref:hypothetical protein n=1 Tax=Terrihabitans sp. B22-R8 TaxID=3425128 RepID=UPI00403C69C3
MTLAWTDTLAAPRSLATRDTLAVTIVEDPGIIDLRVTGEPGGTFTALGVSLPIRSGSSVEHSGLRILCTAPGAWRVLAPREAIAGIVASLRAEHPDAAIVDLTGGFSAFRLVGGTAFELLLRVCPDDLTGLEKETARETSIAGLSCLLLREPGPVESWLALVPRSLSTHAAEALVNAARTPGRLVLFEAGAPPPV